ncbi:hypothetical protein PVAP13_5KG003612 [Panicum virgatum]|uniref:Uncharacterized protein n=1 Tax=Panicum virgatum TaxID=38727 RepID=A0A8T0SC24_PANVG|nr:hypothetical protein PVAP13_5KG003612 [Panicum virgatum]
MQRRQKRRHDPRNQMEVPPPNPSRELRPRQRTGKEPAGSSSRKEPRKAPYIMQGQPMHPPSRANPTRRSIAHDICPNTPPRMQVEYSSEQRTYPHIPRLKRPGIVHGFEVEMGRNYYKQDVALREACKEEVYKYQKNFYSSVVMRKSRAPIVPCKYVDWTYYENMNDPFFNAAMNKCKEMGLYDIIGFRYDWNEEILDQFHCSLYYDEREIL